MKIDTTVLAGWEGRTVTLRFMHGVMDKGGNVQPYPGFYHDGTKPAPPRATVAVIHEHRDSLDVGDLEEFDGWEKKKGEAGGYSRVVAVGVSQVLPEGSVTQKRLAGTTRSSACWRSAPPTTPSTVSRTYRRRLMRVLRRG